MRSALVFVLLALARVAHAQEDPDTQAARRHYERGAQLYNHDRYEEAVREFSTAKSLKPTPAFEFNIGRCYDRLERWRDAADAYERYLAAEPSAADAGELKARIAMLRARAQAVVSSSPPPLKTPRPLYKRGWFWAAIAGGAAAVALGVGLGLGLSARSDPSHPIMDVHF